MCRRRGCGEVPLQVRGEKKVVGGGGLGRGVGRSGGSSDRIWGGFATDATWIM